MLRTIKSIALATAVIAGVQIASASADIFTDTQRSAPRAPFSDLDGTAPRSDSVFGPLDLSALRSDSFTDTSRTAARSDGVFGTLEGNAP